MHVFWNYKQLLCQIHTHRCLIRPGVGSYCGEKKKRESALIYCSLFLATWPVHESDIYLACLTTSKALPEALYFTFNRSANSTEAFCQRGQIITCKAKIRVMQTWFKGFWGTGYNTSVKHMNKKTGKPASRENAIWSLSLITSDKNNDLPISGMKAGVHKLWVDKLFIGKCVGQQNQGQRGTHTGKPRTWKIQEDRGPRETRKRRQSYNKLHFDVLCCVLSTVSVIGCMLSSIYLIELICYER